MKKIETTAPVAPIAIWSFHGLPKEIAESLSALTLARGACWVGADEGTSIARLVHQSGGDWEAETTSEVAQLLWLPAWEPDKKGRLAEVDVEGMDSRDGFLWVIGSHSLKRKKPDKDDEEESIARLAEVSSDGNRYVLGRLALDGEGSLVAPADYSAESCAARLECDRHGSALLEALRKDEHLGRFIRAGGEEAETVNIPGKDNGLDLEGLAIVGADHLLLGLRGPVLRGWAMLLEIKVESHFAGPNRPALLTLKHFDKVDRPYRKIFLDLDGLGVRDLCWDGDDLLILAGPTMVLPWPPTVYRWRDVREELSKHDRLIPREDLALELLGKAAPADRAESVAVVDHEGEKALLIAYDNPERFAGGVVTADIFPLASKQGASERRDV